MKFRDVLIGSAIAGMFSYIVSAVLITFLLDRSSYSSNIVRNIIIPFPVIPVTIGLVIFLIYFSYYSLVDITPSTWEFSEKWDKFNQPEYRQ